MVSLSVRTFVGIVGIFVASGVLWSLFSALGWLTSLVGGALGIAFTLGGALVLALILLATSKSLVVTAGVFILVGLALLIASVSSGILHFVESVFAFPFQSLGGALLTAGIGMVLGSLAPADRRTAPSRVYPG